MDMFPAPFAEPDYKMLRVAVTAPDYSEQWDPISLILLVDTSGSMEADNRLGTARRIMADMVNALNPADRVALVSYSEHHHSPCQTTGHGRQPPNPQPADPANCSPHAIRQHLSGEEAC